MPGFVERDVAQQAQRLIRLGTSRYASGDLDGALSFWRMAAASAPGDVRAQAYLAWGQWKRDGGAKVDRPPAVEPLVPEPRSALLPPDEEITGERPPDEEPTSERGPIVDEPTHVLDRAPGPLHGLALEGVTSDEEPTGERLPDEQGTGERDRHVSAVGGRPSDVVPGALDSRDEDE